jgi:hypothetical protein
MIGSMVFLVFSLLAHDVLALYFLLRKTAEVGK